MGKRIQRLQTWMIEYAYLVMIACVMAMVVGCALYTRALQQNADVQAAADAPEIRMTAQPTHTPVLTPLPTIAPVRPVAWMRQGGMWPLDGQVLRVYDDRQIVYWERLNAWKAHCGLDIGGKPGDVVKACMDGTVTDTAYDALWGWQITMDHHDGWQMRYAGLEHCAVQEGDQVRCGRIIGTLMENIPCEGEMETHLHLEAHRDGKRQDPEAALAER